MNKLFDLCVDLLIYLAKMLGMTYKEINIWIFVIIWPIVTLILVVIVIYQWKKIKKLTNR